MTIITRISLVRHGQVHNPLDLYYGHLPRFGLSAAGRIEARRAASLLSNQAVTALYCSPLLRARQTAIEIGVGLPKIPRRLSHLLIEARTPFDGQTRLELEARHWDLYTGAPAPFEQPADLVRRVQSFIARARRLHPGQHVVGVTHGDLIAFTFLWAQGAPLTPLQKRHLLAWGMSDDYPAHASITTLTFSTPAPDETPMVTYVNSHAH
jgi:broad specificity phosphatase PhoE